VIRLFKSNDPYLLLVVLAILVLVRLAGGIYGFPLTDFELKWLLLGERLSQGFLMYGETFDYTGPLSAYTYKALAWLGGRSRILPQVLASVIIVVQAGQLNLLLLRNNAFNENNYFPALFYVLLACSLPDGAILSPALMSLTFILIALNNVFRRIDNIVRDEIFLSAGLYLGVATLFYLPSLVFFLFFLIALLLFSSPAPRRVALYMYGLILPFLIALGYFHWADAHWPFIDSFFRGILDESTYKVETYFLLLTGSLFFFFLIVAGPAVLIRGRFTNYQSKIFRVMLLLIPAALLVFLVDVEKGVHQLIFLVPTLSFLLTHYVLLLKKRIWKTVIPYLIVVFMILFPYLIYSQYPSELDNRLVKRPENSLMYLGNELTPYLQSTIASPFIDPTLSQQWLERLGYYQSAERIYDIMNRSNPDRIEDEWDFMDEVFFRFPLLESKYLGQGDSYQRID